MQTDNNPRYFQWLTGERRGEVLILDTIVEEDGNLFLTFKDNSRINEDFVANLNVTDVTGKMMAEVENTSKLWQFKEEVINTDDGYVFQDWESQVKYDVPSTTEIASDGQKIPTKKKKITLIPPLSTRGDVVKSKFGTIINTPVPPAPVPQIPEVELQKSNIDQNDPVWIMMNKSKKKDIEVNMTLTISLPPQSLFDVVKDSFEDGDTKALEYIIENIDISDIKIALKEGIREMYNPPSGEESSDIHRYVTGSDPMEIPEVDMNSSGVKMWEPECTEEPIVSDPKPQEIVDKIEGLKEK